MDQNALRTLYMVELPPNGIYAEAALIHVTYDYTKIATCPECGQYVSGAYWERPREIVLTSRKIPDFLYAYCDNVDFLLSERALTAIRDAGLTGITCAEKIEHARFQRKAKKEVELPPYYHIELARSRITLDHANSVIQYGKICYPEQYCPLCNQVPRTRDFTRKLAFHLDAYEGYDIFQTYELGDAVFLSQRFVDVCKEKKLKNLCYTPVEQDGRWAAEYFLDGNENAAELYRHHLR